MYAYGALLIVPPLTLLESKYNVENGTHTFEMRNQPLAAPELLNNMVCNWWTTWFVTVLYAVASSWHH